MSDEKKPPVRKDRRRAKKKTYKLTERHVKMIRSQKGKQSVREIAKWFARETHYIYKVSPSMVHHILSGKRHSKKEDQKSIYDLIEEEVSEEELAKIDKVIKADAATLKILKKTLKKERFSLKIPH
mgnify:CR=1 FL=1